MSKIFVVMGKSSTGKDTVFNSIISDSRISLKTVVMYTTRPMREGEVNGKTYYFTSDTIAKELEKDKKIIEIRKYNTVYGVWKYFTADDGQIIIDGKDNYIVIGTLEAYQKFIEYYGNERVVPIYIEIDDGTRIKRAILREEQQEIPKYAEMCRRYLADENDFSEQKISLLGIKKRYVNDNLSECVNQIISDIKKEI